MTHVIDMTSRLSHRRLTFFRRALAILWSVAPVATLLKVGLLILQGAFPALTLYLTKSIIDAVAALLRSPVADSTGVLWLAAAMGIVTVASAGCTRLSAVVTEAQQQAVTDYVLSLVHAKSIEIDLADYESAEHRDIMYRAQRDAPHRSIQIIEIVAAVAENAAVFISLVGLVFAQNWIIATIFLFSVVPGTLVRARYSRRLYAAHRRETPFERRWLYFHWLLTLENYAKEIRLYDLGQFFTKRAHRLRRALTAYRLRFFRRRAAIEFLAELPGGLAVFGGLLYVLRETLTGAVTLGDLVIFYQAFQRGYSSLSQAMGGMVRLYEESLFLENLFEFLDLEPRVTDIAAPLPLPLPMKRGLAFENVTFAYDNSERPVLQGISFTIRPGDHIALVGANGAGKTTLVKLLCRLYDPTAGRITWDGIDLRELSLPQLRRQIGVIFQDHAHYNLTARENIWLGDTSLELNDPRIAAAAADAGADTVVEKLRYGYRTRLGNWFPDDQEISIGEWQKIAIARVFFRNSGIIVLDEPTSALDAASEYEVFQKFRRLAASRTTVVISHRFSSVQMADRIYVIADGRVSEVGSHRELMERGGEYARMFELQASSYR